MGERTLMSCPKCRRRLGSWNPGPSSDRRWGASAAGVVVLAVIVILILRSEEREHHPSIDPSSSSPTHIATQPAEKKPDVTSRSSTTNIATQPAREKPEVPSRSGSADIATPLAEERPEAPSWVTINYKGMINSAWMVQTGDPIFTAMNQLTENPEHPDLRAVLQPFLDRFSPLLQDAVEMINGPDDLPHRNIADYFPVGTEQPAWAAILRSGRICVTWDGATHCRVFLPGKKGPRALYEEHYGVIRHCLAAMVPSDGSQLKVEVYAYQNNYANAELKLNQRPYVVSTADFPAPPNRIPLDLEGLRSFFEDGGVLEGAHLDAQEGLVLLARRGPRQTVAGQPITLADLAVAYRAVCHAGDNKAFISLDPHKNPTKVTVNFGGFLEDTHVGAVVLEADKRFKTITCGLDPNSKEDLRATVRQAVPSFRTSMERGLLAPHGFDSGKWIGTRFWFYPESIEVESDLGMEYCRIVNARFTADAERSRDDFQNMQQFESRKKRDLSPSIRANIEHLNTQYSDFAKIFPELEELDTVAQLFGVCTWIQKANKGTVDFDALLSVTLPSFRTDREQLQFMSIGGIFIAKDQLGASDATQRSVVMYVTPLLEKSCRDVFETSAGMEQYLCYRNHKDPSLHAEYADQATRLFEGYSNKAVKTLIKNELDLKALMSFLRNRIEIAPPREAKEFEDYVDKETRRLDSLEEQMKRLEERLEENAGLADQFEKDSNRLNLVQAELDQLKRRMATNAETHNALLPRYNSLVAEHNALGEKMKLYLERAEAHDAVVSRYNLLAQEYNALVEKMRIVGEEFEKTITARGIAEIGGGINLEPEHFTIRRGPVSPQLSAFIKQTATATLAWKEVGDSSGLVRNRYSRPKTPSTHVAAIPHNRWTVKKTETANGSRFVHSTEQDQQRWLVKKAETGSWRDQTQYEARDYRQRHFDARHGIIRIARHRRGRVTSIIGHKVDDNTIVFSRSDDAALPPSDPPLWWEEVKAESQ